MTALRLLLAAALLGGAVGCGSSGSPAAGSRSTVRAGGVAPTAPVPARSTGSGSAGAAADPCALLSSADAAALKLHYPGSATSMDLGPACDFGAMQFTVVNAGVSVQSFTSGASKPLPGLGQQAYYGQDFHWLRVKTAHSRFEVRCLLCDSATEEATLKSAAQKVLAHVS